jgi:hypothetical protein
VFSNCSRAQADSISHLRDRQFPRAWRFKPPCDSRLGERRELVCVLLARSAASATELDDVERCRTLAVLRNEAAAQRQTPTAGTPKEGLLAAVVAIRSRFGYGAIGLGCVGIRYSAAVLR